MPRPSRHLDQALLASGAALYPALGCAGLSVRAVASLAGVTAGMFHYHFESKDAFLQQVLQGIYEELFSRLSAPAHRPGAPLVRLRGTLTVIARFLRDHAPLMRRVLGDAQAGHAVATEFLQRNLPRHVEVVVALLAEAEQLLIDRGVVQKGDLIVLTIGEPIGCSGGTNTLKIVRVGEHQII